MEGPAVGGWIRLYRAMKDNGHLQMPDKAFKVFVYCLLQVNRKSGAGCQPGEGWITYQMIRESCCDPDKPPWNDHTINSALDFLEDREYIQRVKTKRGSAQRVRIVNWDKYQAESTADTAEVTAEVKAVVTTEVATDKQEGREGKEVIPSQPSAEKQNETKPKRQRKPKKEPDPFNISAKPLLERLDAWMKANKTAGITDWGAATKIMASALRGSSGPAIPSEEIIDALAWGTKQPRWKPQLLGKGPEVVRAVWADWKAGTPQGGYGSNRYHDHTKTEATGESVLE